jgi:hypothetical protein
MEKYEFSKAEVIDLLGVRDTCTEGFKFKCKNCGTLDSVAVWFENDHSCRACEGKDYEHICSRCDSSIVLIEGSSEHPCNSKKIYLDSNRIIFYDEMVALLAKRKKHSTSEHVIKEKLPEPEKELLPIKKEIPKTESTPISETKITSVFPVKEKKKISEITQKIYNMGLIPRSVIKAIRHFFAIITFSKE